MGMSKFKAEASSEVDDRERAFRNRGSVLMKMQVKLKLK